MKKCTHITIKGPFKTKGENKGIKNTPHMKFKNIKGNFYKKNWKNFKIEGSRAKFLDFDFKI